MSKLFTSSNPLPMSHLIYYIISLLGGFCGLLCELLIAVKYLDAAIKFYTQRFDKVVWYVYGIFAAVMIVTVITAMIVTIVKLNSQTTLLAVFCDLSTMDLVKNGLIVMIIVVSVCGSVIFLTALIAMFFLRRYIVMNTARLGI